jgi:hypothetical protein
MERGTAALLTSIVRIEATSGPLEALFEVQDKQVTSGNHRFVEPAARH